MLKALNINDVLVTPYTATKDWHVSNNENTNLILFEHTASDGSDIAVAIDFLDYSSGFPVVNSSCSLANDQQPLNRINYREGQKLEGFFSLTEPQNLDLTYKRSVFSQIQTMFYNNYRDPTKMWGLENIDFDKSQAKKFLTDKFVVLDVPTTVFGEKILPNTVVLNDSTSDNNYTITDDGNTNLFIGTNLFSKQQELRPFGNIFVSSSDATCNSYFNLSPPSPPVLSGLAKAGSFLFGTGSLSWSEGVAVNGYTLQKSLDGISFLTLASLGGGVSTYDDYPISSSTFYYYRISTFNFLGSSSFSNIVSVFIANIFDTWDEYALGQAGAFNSGSGWVNPWYVDSINRLVASESWNEYVPGQQNSFGGDFGWFAPWTQSAYLNFLASSESWDEYTINQTTNFTGGGGWTSTVWNFPSMSYSTESWDEYSLGQTSNFNAGYAWSSSKWFDFSSSI